MIETDKIVLAELAAQLLKSGQLPLEQENELKNLLDKYPDAKESLQKRLSNTDIYLPFDLRTIDIEKEWSILQEKYRQNSQRRLALKPGKLFYLRKTWQKASVIAAAMAVPLFTIIWFWTIQSKPAAFIVPDQIYGYKNDVLPGGIGAILKIDGKKEIHLMDRNANENISAGIEFKEGKLLYTAHPIADENLLNTLIVPTRSMLALTLRDGTRVWVNSASELTYKENFDRKERRVKLKGEAYFEVAKDAKRPFIVETSNANIEAVGTAFNINSYQSSTKVSLTEGRLKVSNHDNEIYMQAGSQAEIINKKLRTYPIVNRAEPTAFKDGYFYFKNKNMQQILDELSRWYGVKVDCKVTLDHQRYEGGIKKTVTLAEACSVLQDLTGYHLSIDHDNLIVSK